MTPKQERFVVEYLLDCNATQAAIRAGYSERTAASQGERLLRKVEIQTAIVSAQAERSQRVQITADEVLKGLRAEATRMGRGSSHSARVAAWHHLGKHLGLFLDRVEHLGAVDVGTELDLTKLTDEQLETLQGLVAAASPGD